MHMSPYKVPVRLRITYFQPSKKKKKKKMTFLPLDSKMKTFHYITLYM